jgi:3-oxoacyl-[acyl-carrier protein] reductase
MGRAIAERLSRSGRVVSADLPAEGWVAADQHRLGVDVSDSGSVTALVEDASELLGGLDVVVNCAGILGPVVATTESTNEDFDQVMRVNLYGAYHVSRAAIPVLLKGEDPRLVHIASIAGKEGNPRMAAYSASKAGVIGLVKSLGREYAETPLTVNAIAPAIIDTPLIDGMSDERRAVQRELVPMRRFGRPDEAAALIEYIASPASSFTTGFVFDLSGGRATY